MSAAAVDPGLVLVIVTGLVPLALHAAVVLRALHLVSRARPVPLRQLLASLTASSQCLRVLFVAAASAAYLVKQLDWLLAIRFAEAGIPEIVKANLLEAAFGVVGYIAISDLGRCTRCGIVKLLDRRKDRQREQP